MASYAERPTYLANVLTTLREVNEFSQADVAKRIGITRSAYSYYELGKSEPNSETLSLLSRMYAVPIETFFRPMNLNPISATAGRITRQARQAPAYQGLPIWAGWIMRKGIWSRCSGFLMMKKSAGLWKA